MIAPFGIILFLQLAKVVVAIFGYDILVVILGGRAACHKVSGHKLQLPHLIVSNPCDHGGRAAGKVLLDFGHSSSQIIINRDLLGSETIGAHRRKNGSDPSIQHVIFVIGLVIIGVPEPNLVPVGIISVIRSNRRRVIIDSDADAPATVIIRALGAIAVGINICFSATGGVIFGRGV